MQLLELKFYSDRYHVMQGGSDESSCKERDKHHPIPRGFAATFIRDLSRHPRELDLLKRILGHRGRLTKEESLKLIRQQIEAGRITLVHCRIKPTGGGGSGTHTGADSGGNSNNSDQRDDSSQKPEAPVKTWIEIELVDEAGQPAAMERYEIKLPDGSLQEGRLDGNGRARYSQIDPGTCQVSFPDFHGAEWHA